MLLNCYLVVFFSSSTRWHLWIFLRANFFTAV